MEFDVEGDNLDQVVHETGGGAATIIDNGLGSTWEFDPDQAAFAVELVNTDAEMLGEGIECTTLSLLPITITSSGMKNVLLTRPESRGVVSDIFHRFTKEFDGGSVSAITGSPGIGKSWTLFYALQQALLYDGATVLFFSQKENHVALYLRRSNKIHAWTSESRSEAQSTLFDRLDVLVSLDPKESDKGSASFIMGKMKLLYAASNNKAHISLSKKGTW